jgi:ABC-2 type transport system ATP-binding protein
VFLTTHYMEEAQRLADRVAIIAAGEIVASGTPDELGDRENRPTRITFRLPEGVAVADLPDALAVSSGANGSVEVVTDDPTTALNTVTGWALSRGLALESLECRRPSLEDIYLELTGADEPQPDEVGVS